MVDIEDVIIQSTMMKKGRKKDWFSLINPWAERRIVLNSGGVIKYFDGAKYRGEINIMECQIFTKKPEEAEGKNFAFTIQPKNSDEPPLMISAMNERERDIWIQCIIYVSNGLWDCAKEAESISEARKMPFPVKVPEFGDENENEYDESFSTPTSSTNASASASANATGTTVNDITVSTEVSTEIETETEKGIGGSIEVVAGTGQIVTGNVPVSVRNKDGTTTNTANRTTTSNSNN